LESSRTRDRSADALERVVRDAQADARLPSVAAAAFRGGELLWRRAVGLADVDAGEKAGVEHQYRVASITKTFVAAAVFQLREAGRLELDDELGRHVPEAAAHRTLTLRRMLGHMSGLQREPVGEVWERLEAPSREELLERLGEAEQVLAAGEEWHYSNLAYAMLGEVVARASGLDVESYIEERLLTPLGLASTGWSATKPARGYHVDPFADAVEAEPEVSMGGTNAAGGLWSTVGDLARWASFLLAPDPAVLSPASAQQMHSVQGMVDAEAWTAAHGLGLQLWRRGDRVFAGHTGGFPGYASILAWSPKEQTGGVLLTAAGAWPQLIETGLRLVETAIEELPAPREPWQPQARPPSHVAPLLGRWWSEGQEFVFSWREGRLEARLAAAPTALPPAVFERDADDRWRTVSGRERGELLRVVRDDGGDVVKLYWATYPFRRQPFSFGGGLEPVDQAPDASQS
jgi:CubicO group peptidase (beta-lactamase class C family)